MVEPGPYALGPDDWGGYDAGGATKTRGGDVAKLDRQPGGWRAGLAGDDPVANGDGDVSESAERPCGRLAWCDMALPVLVRGQSLI